MTFKLTKNQLKFIGTERKLENGCRQKVVGFHGKSKSGEAIFKISCEICDYYSDIFPDKILMTKHNFNKGVVSCLCNDRSFMPKGENQKNAYYRKIVEDELHGYKYLTYTVNKGSTLLVLECNVCSSDYEMFPEGTILYNIHTKTVTCPCYSKFYRKTSHQFKILIERRCLSVGYEVVYLDDNISSGSTITLLNPVTGNIWDTSVDNFLNNKRGDPKNATLATAERCRKPLLVVNKNIQEHLKVLQGCFLGWEGEYRNNLSRFNWRCKNGHLITSKVVGFLNLKNGCKECIKTETNLYGYFPDRLSHVDNLYVVSVDNRYLKVGRTFDIENRLSGLKSQSGCKDIKFIFTIKGWHKDIFNLEQSLLELLKVNGKLDMCGWTTESCSLDSIPLIKTCVVEFLGKVKEK